MKKRVVSVVTAVIMALTLVFPAAALLARSETVYPTPAGYAELDYQKLVSFLETEDEEGVKNGEKLSDDYDPADPSTWYYEEVYEDEDGDTWIDSFGIFWMEFDDLMYAVNVFLSDMGMTGDADFAGMRYLCSVHLDLNYGIVSVDVSGCSELFELFASDNPLVSLNVSGCTSLSSLGCDQTDLTSIDLSDCTQLDCFYGEYCPFTELDLSACGSIFIDDIRAEGGGTVSAYIVPDGCVLHERANEGRIFAGWYNEAGELLSMQEDFGGWAEWDDEWENIIAPDPITQTGEKVWIARFVDLADMEVCESEAETLRSFFNLEDGDGVRNGDKLFSAYDPDDFTTWTEVTVYEEDDGYTWESTMGVTWHCVGDLLHAYYVEIGYSRLVGSIDFSGFSNLAVLYCGGNLLYSLNVSGCPELRELYCDNNPLTSLVLNDCPQLNSIYTPAREYDELDFTGCDLIHIDRIVNEGGGCIAYCQDYSEAYVIAESSEGRSFEGWYDEDGELISMDEHFGGESYWDENDEYHPNPVVESGVKTWTARFIDDSTLEYSEYDFAKVRAFLEQRDENGVRNGEKINPDYDPDDPETWKKEIYYEDIDYTEEIGVSWRGLGNYRFVSSIYAPFCWLAGDLDLSGLLGLQWVYCASNDLTSANFNGCVELLDVSMNGNNITELKLEDCRSLWNLECSYNNISELDISQCVNLIYFYCSWNDLTELDVSSCPGLYLLWVEGNELEELDVSALTELQSLDCMRNKLSELDLTNNQYALIESVTAEGDGYVGYSYYNYEGNDYASEYLRAEAADGARFVGWFSPDGELLSTLPELGGPGWEDDGDGNGHETPDPIAETGETVWIARFEPDDTVPGDSNGDGVVDTVDALIVLRCALGISGDESEILVNCDMDGNGLIDTTDALIILRMALGII